MRWLDVAAFVLGAAIGVQADAQSLVSDAPLVLRQAQDERNSVEVSGPSVQSVQKFARKDAVLDQAAPHTLRFVVTFKHAHTRERLPFARVVSAAEVSHFLRCRATGREVEMAPVLVPLAASIAHDLGADAIDVVSGYRSPKLNEMLRKKGRQVASESQHTFGQALDFKVSGASARDLTRLAEQRHVGGIGTYSQSGFIHVDIGRNRRWRGR